MADYEGLIRVGVQGIPEIDRLNRSLEKAAENFGNIENASIIANQIGQSANRRLESARRRMERAGYERTQANRILENVDQRRNPRTGRFEPGPNATARRLAASNLRLAQRETREAARSLAEEERNRRLVSAAERRYAIALNEAADSMAGIQNSIGQRQDAMDRLTRRIGGESRGNYLTNLFQGRQAEFVRGGAGRNLPRNLQAQARANLAAWELTNVGGRENLTLMSRLATEISGLVRQQNEMNRRRTSRSTTYETGRRGQERITELSRMPGADPERIRRLRSQATQVIAAGYRNDAPEIRLTTRRMNASIARYQRELEAAARELREQRVAQVRDFNIRQGWRAITAEAQQRAEQNRRALPSKNLLAERIARTPGAIAPVDLIKLRKKQEADFAAKQKSSAKNLNVQLGWQKALEDMQNIQLSIQRSSGERFRKKLEAEQKRQERLGIGATTPMRVGAPVRRTGAIPLGGGIDSGILPKALPDKNLLAQRIARTPGAIAPVRLDELQKQQQRIAEQNQREQERIARMRQMASPIQGTKDIVDSPAYLEEQRKQQERIARQNQREQERIARTRQMASPIKGTKDTPGSPAYLREQQKQANANERLKTAMERQSSTIAAREDRLSKLGEKGIDTSQLQTRLDKAKTLAGDSSVKAQEKFKRSIIDLDRNIVRLSASVKKEAKAAAEARQQRVAQMRNFNIRQSWRAITEEAWQRAEQNRRALPDKNLLAQRIARTPGGTAPTRLDELREQEEKRLAREAKMAPVPGRRLREKREAERKRQERLGIGVNAPVRVGGPVRRSGAIPMGGQGGRFGMFDQYSSPAGPGNLAGAREFREIQRIARMRQIASPIRGTKDIVDSPAWKKEQERINKQKQGAQTPGFFRGNPRQALGEGLIGGAFPALFGQGAAASVGGAVGGIAGGAIGGTFGFGLALVGTALGQAVDTTAKNLSDLAAALKSPNDAIKALETNGYRVSDSLKFQVEQLQAVGRGYDAQTLVLKEVEKRLGAGSVKELNALSTEQKKLDESYAILAGTIQRSILPGVIGFTLALQDLLGFLNAIGKSRDPSVDISKRNYRFNPFTGKLVDIGPLEKTGYQKRVDQAIARASQAPPLSPQERFANETTRIQESRKIADQIQSAYREAFNLQRQAHDLQRDGATLNKEIADYTYRKEREIFDLRQQAAEKQIENNRAAAQNRIESGDLSARQTFAAAVGFEQQLLSNVREVVRARKEGEADIEQSRNRLELAMAKLNRDVEDYRRTNAREIEDIERRKLSYVRSVEDYRMRVADYVLERSRQSADLMRQAMILPTTGAAPAGAPAAGAPDGTARLLQAANNNLGIFAGQTERCADAIRELFKVAGIAIGSTKKAWDSLPSGPRLASSFFGSDVGQRINRQQDLRPGDLVGFERTYGNWGQGVQTHVGLYAGNGQMYDHSPRRGLVKRPMNTFAGKFMYGVRPNVIAPNNAQGKASTQISDIPAPTFKPTPIGPTPSAAPLNAANLAAAAQLAGGQSEAQRILEDQIKLKQKGIELGQIEAILQTNQLPQLQQQGDALKQQIEARQKIVNLSDNAASIADIEAESRARLKQIEATRILALAQVQKQYKGDVSLVRQVNEQAELAAKIAKGEEEQRRTNLELSNKRQNSEQARLQILQLQEGVAISKVELAALERGELQAGAVELLKASTLYQRSDEAQKSTLVTLTAQTEELQKQKQFMERLVSLQLDATYTGAGLRSGRIGAEARAFEQGLKENRGDIGKATALANATRAAEDRQMVWGNLEKDVVNASNAIAGSLTNGLLDIVSGAKQIEDVGRDMLDTIARSFADSAQQQLATLLQRQFAGMISGSIGAGATAAGPQALNGASLTAAGSLGFLNSAALALGATLQTIAGQSTLYGQMGGGSGLASLFSGAGSAAASGASGLLGFSSSIPQLAPALESAPNFAGFFANGGMLRQGEFGVVGEEEPEFFFPGVTGTVVPRSTVEKAAELRQANQAPGKIDLSYTVTEQRGERYVTEEQFRKGMARTAQQSQAIFVSSVRQNRNVRDSMGL